jgi:hypothetical protein
MIKFNRRIEIAKFATLNGMAAHKIISEESIWVKNNLSPSASLSLCFDHIYVIVDNDEDETLARLYYGG